MTFSQYAINILIDGVMEYMFISVIASSLDKSMNCILLNIKIIQPRENPKLVSVLQTIYITVYTNCKLLHRFQRNMLLCGMNTTSAMKYFSSGIIENARSSML